MKSTRTYNRYPTGLKLQYAVTGLTNKVRKSIPRSTRQHWKRLSAAQFYTCASDAFDDDDLLLVSLLNENKKLRQLLRLAACMICLYRQLPAPLNLQRSIATTHKACVGRLIREGSSLVTKKLLWKWMPFTGRQWGAWTGRKACKASLLTLCRRQHPSQLTTAEQSAIRAGCSEPLYQHWSLSSIYYQLMNDNKLHCSISTFYKYCRLMAITRKRARKAVNYSSITAGRPFEILHMDITLFKTKDGIRHYIYVIRDNFSRALLACNATLEYSSMKAKETLEEVLIKYKLMDKTGTLVTDDGTENKGALTRFLAEAGMRWKHSIARLDITESNSMVEAGIKLMKYNYLFRLQPADTFELQNQLRQSKAEMGDIPLKVLHGYTPNQVLDGAIPDKHAYKARIATATNNRVQQNQQVPCKDTC